MEEVNKLITDINKLNTELLILELKLENPNIYDKNLKDKVNQLSSFKTVLKQFKAV